MAELESKILARAPAPRRKEGIPTLRVPIRAYVEGSLFLIGLAAATAAGFYIWIG